MLWFIFLCHGLFVAVKMNHRVGKGLVTGSNNWRVNCKLIKVELNVRRNMQVGSTQLHRFLIDNLNTALLLLNDDLTVEYLNPAFEALLKVSSSRLNGCPASALFRDGSNVMQSIQTSLATDDLSRGGMSFWTVIQPSQLRWIIRLFL